MRFEYYEPSTIQEAIALLSEKEAVKLMAGGTDLLVGMKMQKYSYGSVVALTKIPDLSSVLYDESQGLLRIGALATHNDILASQDVQTKYLALAEACLLVGSRQVRNLGTVVGNICNASPSAETAGPLLVYDARMSIVGPSGQRIVPLRDFFEGPGKTVLAANEIATELQVPNPEPNSGAAYLKLSPRRAMDLAVVGVAVYVALKNGVCARARIALGAVAPIPMRAPKAEAILMGQPLTDELIASAAQWASEESRPITDIRGSAWYRREMVGVLVRRAAKLALDRAGR
ncbi:MAG: xanthine dehydrogenase family protein subunit M [Chloroflexi bacterium]|nr:xanthine dehydrogenase family protein subunit M [Chloroflexota bacterium]